MIKRRDTQRGERLFVRGRGSEEVKPDGSAVVRLGRPSNHPAAMDCNCVLRVSRYDSNQPEDRTKKVSLLSDVDSSGQVLSQSV